MINNNERISIMIDIIIGDIINNNNNNNAWGVLEG